MHEKRFHREIARLRDPERVARLEVERVVRLALEDLNAPAAMVDIGVGSAVFAEAFAAQGLTIGGVDANPEMLPEARRFVPGGDFRESTAEQLPFGDNAFDLAFLGLVLHETDDPAAALREAGRVSRQRVAVLEWPPVEQPFGPPLHERLTPVHMTELAEQAGLPTPRLTLLNALALYRFDLGGEKEE